MVIYLREKFIKLGQALKAANLAENGVDAKIAIQNGEVLVNGETETRRGRKLYAGEASTCATLVIRALRSMARFRALRTSGLSKGSFAQLMS